MAEGARRGLADAWRASHGCIAWSARVPFARKGGQEQWPTAGGARQAVTRACSAGVRGGERRGRSKAKSRAERAVFAREIGEKGDARGGYAASARCRGAWSVERSAGGPRGGRSIVAEQRNRRCRAARDRAGVQAGGRVGRCRPAARELADRWVGLHRGGRPVGQLAHVGLVPGLSWVG